MKDDIGQVLEEIARSGGFLLTGKKATYSQIADQLNHLTQPQKHWTWNYIHEVAHGKLKPSRELITRILRLRNKLNIHATQVREFVRIEILAPVDFVIPGAIVNTTSRRCSSKLCDRNFIPVHPRQRFCSPECRKISRQRQ
jgi:hypothetical protein